MLRSALFHFIVTQEKETLHNFPPSNPVQLNFVCISNQSLGIYVGIIEPNFQLTICKNTLTKKMQNHLKSLERLDLTICNFLWNRVLDLNI